MGEFAALIPAAGFSSRMGEFKPLLPIQSTLAIERPILAFKQAGIEDIRVVAGYNADRLIPVMSKHNVKVVMNNEFQKGMYSSVKAGVRTLDDSVEAFFILPADYPLVTPETIKLLKSHFISKSNEVVFPCYNGKKGHPPLISTCLKDEILFSEPKEGLKTILNNRNRKCSYVSVPDPGILIDMDTKQDYEYALEYSLSKNT